MTSIIISLSICVLVSLHLLSYSYDRHQFTKEIERRKQHYQLTGSRLKK